MPGKIVVLAKGEAVKENIRGAAAIFPPFWYFFTPDVLEGNARIQIQQIC